jgi:NADH-quinone oxidoreductase subunit L
VALLEARLGAQCSMLYSYSGLILFAPLLAFAIIIFGTRVGDMLSRPHVALPAAPEDHGDPHGGADVHGTDDHTTSHEVEAHDAHGDDHSEHGQDDDDDPKVPSLSVWAKASAYVAISIMALACLFSWFLLLYSVANPNPDFAKNGAEVFQYSWVTFASHSYDIHFRLDQLAITMLVVVTTVSLLVQIYSRGYMENSAGYSRFYAYLSLFAFSMLVIVFAANFLVMFVGWELVGLSSYLLIGFWINKRAKPEEQRPSPANAQLQAFVANRVGDVGFIIGIMILFTTLGTFDFATLFKLAPTMDKNLLTIAMICVFCGSIGKSAQLPLHVWLPSAMEGPTPVSALIHAATMVAAGVYMVARTFPLFLAAGPAALGTVAWVGGITALFAATIALVQTDFKRVLAFSTISQLGYMFVGLGVSNAELGVGPGMFHLFTHAFFKALLFLGAGSVIDSLHHATHKETQDMRQMGGLATRMPITAITWLIATLAISGFPFFSGFYSKENIIGLTLEQGDYGLYALTLLTAGLTAFYMLRAYIQAFGGRDGKFFGLWGGTYRGVGTPHESPLTMTIPLSILAVFAIFAGYWSGFFSYAQPGSAPLDIPHLLSLPDTWIGVLVSFIGLGWAWFLYARVDAVRLNAVVQNNAFLRVLHQFLFNRWYIDNLYDWFIKYVILGIARLEQAFDANVIDGIVNGIARLVNVSGRDLRRVETGRVQSYMIGFFGGVALLAVLVFVLVFTRG